jgi:hypothetical protein
MPKKLHRDKHKKPLMRSRTSPAAARTHSVKDLLRRGPAILTRVTDQQARSDRWRLRLARTRISGVSEQDGNLCIFATSAAWSARLRFALIELEGDLRRAEPTLRAIEVRVLPRP